MQEKKEKEESEKEDEGKKWTIVYVFSVSTACFKFTKMSLLSSCLYYYKRLRKFSSFSLDCKALLFSY